MTFANNKNKKKITSPKFFIILIRSKSSFPSETSSICFKIAEI